jgi:hypothetical protein
MAVHSIEMLFTTRPPTLGTLPPNLSIAEIAGPLEAVELTAVNAYLWLAAFLTVCH